MPTLSFRMLFIASLILLFLPSAGAQDRGEYPWRGDISLTGMALAGNLNQLQLQGRISVSYSDARKGNDFISTGYWMWMKPTPEADYVKIGGDFSATTIPFYYFTPKFYLQGYGRYESSQLHSLDARVNGGMGLGFAPVRRQDFLLRAALSAQVEHARYPTAELTGGYEGPDRTVARAALVSNGWYRVKGKPVSLRYVGNVMVNPMDIQDYRLMLDSSIDVRVSARLSARMAVLYTRDSVVPLEVAPSDVRVTFGLSASPFKTSP